MQDLLQGLQNAREIVASGPIILEALHRKLIDPELTPLQRLMIMRNAGFQITRHPPDSHNQQRRHRMEYNFGPYKAIRTRINYV